MAIPAVAPMAVRRAIGSFTVSKKRKRIALAVAAVADAIQLGLFPIFVEGAFSIPDDALDIVVAIACIGILGFRARLLLAIAAELVPGLSLFPSWTLAILSLKTEEEVVPLLVPSESTAVSSNAVSPAFSGSEGSRGALSSRAAVRREES